MATEIELKAHVTEVETIKLLLFDKAAFLWAFEKNDAYWYKDGLSGSGIRIRREKLTFPDESEKLSCLVTYKTKELTDGIEINDEKEFEISSRTEGEESVFGELLLRLGLKPGISKRKRGWAFNREGINAELCEVENLGWFIEMEILLNDGTEKSEEIYAESRKRLLSFLDSLGIKREAIESRYYTEMLRAL